MRCQFISREAQLVFDIKDTLSNHNLDHKEQVLNNINKQILDQSLLAQHIKTLYHGLTTIIQQQTNYKDNHFNINDNNDVTLPFINLKLNNYFVIDFTPPINENEIKELNEYDTLLLTSSKELILKSLPIDSSNILKNLF